MGRGGGERGGEEGREGMGGGERGKWRRGETTVKDLIFLPSILSSPNSPKSSGIASTNLHAKLVALWWTSQRVLAVQKTTRLL